VKHLNSVIVDDLDWLRTLVQESPDAASLQPIGIKEVVRGRGAVQTLPDVLERCGVDAGSVLTVISDNTRKRYRSSDVLDVVLGVLHANYHVELVLVAPRPSTTLVHADEVTVSDAVETTRRGAPQALISVGSGTIVDIGKVVAHHLSLAHVVVQTAASVNGFADNQSVLLIDGVKRTTLSQWPDALLIDPWTVSEAPIEMTRSGFGDQLSMYSAAADWYLASAVGYDTSYSATPVSMMRRDVDDLIWAANELGWGDQNTVNLLASCLTMGGLAMGVAGRTAPSSGTEHLVSHLLEMHGDALAVATASHGSQVGAASVFAALVWQHVRQRLRSGSVHVDAANIADYGRVKDAFTHLDATGAMAEECWKAYQRKSRWIRLHLDDIDKILRDWSTHDAEFDQLLKPVEFVATALERAQAPVTFAQLEPAPEGAVIEWAATNCHLMRDRFTVVDLASLIGVWNAADVTDVLAQQTALGRR
jgi:glycerol-1-phosphate dehydrogenase [NAD(P)+]